MQSGSERLLETHEQVPGPELSTVRVAGQLQIVARCFGRRGRARLMRQQDFRARIAGCARQRGCGIAALRRIEMMGAEVGDAGDYQGRTIVGHDRVLVEQHLQAQALEFSRPGAFARVVFVIAGYKKGSMARTQPGERCRVRCELPHRPVDDIACHRDEIRMQAIHCIHDGVNVLFPDCSADMYIADLGDREPVQRTRQVPYRDIDVDDACTPPRA